MGSYPKIASWIETRKIVIPPGDWGLKGGEKKFFLRMWTTLIKLNTDISEIF